ncbi:MAG: hypothetical protein HETSPECPRED_000615 [Heterodermia speciosa]|uniref:Uncharacterized protein n=1 Tax=Heterodermia speciosa TaxID=116794 RepID=A0A8H3IY15_9LECA|nr:MAG: hypothetical protein HETSPECPRED_000615 [Heterodermia speciosa]
MAELLHEISVLKNWLADFRRFDHANHVDHEEAVSYRNLFFDFVVIPILAKLMSRESTTLSDEHPWLVDFYTDSADFNLSLKVFFESMSDMPNILSCYVLRIRCILIRDIWKTEVYNIGNQHPKNPCGEILRLLESPSPVHIDAGAGFEATVWLREESHAEEKRRILNSFKSALKKVDETIGWKSLKSRTLKFNELVGCSALEDPFLNVSALQAKFLKSASARRELALQARIDDLEKRNRDIEQEVRKQRKILASLTFRHTLEHLPPPGEKYEKEAWKKFWLEAVKQANAGQAGPLTDVVRLYGRYDPKGRTVDYINQTGGAALYSALSTNIHQYMDKGSYEVEPDQWNALEAEIFKALKPQNVYPDGSVDWEQERLRYVKP